MQIIISSKYSINDLKDDLQAMHNKLVSRENVMYLLTDSPNYKRKILDLYNDLLASGNAPDLFAADEVDVI